MRSIRLIVAAGVCAVCVACSVAKEQQPEAAPPPPATPDSTAMVKADSTRCGAMTDSTKCVATADSAKRALAAKSGEVPLRDSAVGPKFVLDSTGRPVPIKKRP